MSFRHYSFAISPLRSNAASTPRRKGLRPGAITYGYYRASTAVDAIDEENEAKIVRRIFREYVDGKSPRDIACGLTQDGIPSPSGAARWSHQTLIGGTYGQGMLSNRLYIGESVWNSHRTVKHSRTGKDAKRAVPASEHIVKHLPHLRIIDQDLWDRVQFRRKRRSTGGGKKVGVRKDRSHHLLSGLLRCGACGGNMKIKGKDTEGHSRIVCSASYNYRGCTNSKTYDIEAVQEIAFSNLKKILADKQRVEEGVKEAHRHFNEIAKRNNVERPKLMRELTDTKVGIERAARTIITVGDSPTMSKILQELEVK